MTHMAPGAAGPLLDIERPKEDGPVHGPWVIRQQLRVTTSWRGLLK